MPRVRMNMRGIALDTGKYRLAMDRGGHKLNVNAAGEWLREVVQRVPVQTGMARATLRPLSWFLASAGVDVPVPINAIKKESESRNIPAGLDIAPSPSDCFEMRNGEFLFTFNQKLPHYIFNEWATNVTYSNPSDPNIQPPWLSFSLGRDAYVEFVKQNWQRFLPKAGQFLYTSKVYRV